MKKVVFLTVLGICLFISISLIGSIINLWQKQDLIEGARAKLSREEKENAELKRKLVSASAGDFLEEEARNKLFMVKEGEKTVVIPDSLLEKSELKSEIEKSKVSSFQAWFELFF